MIKNTCQGRDARRTVFGVSLVGLIMLLFCINPKAGGFEQATPQETAAPVALAHFHHLHLNATDPAAAINFYTSKFDCEKGRFAGLLDGVWAQKSWMLFSKVSSPPQWELTSAIWHFGWGAEDMKATYQKQLDSGTKFFTPLTDISDIGGGPAGATGRFFYAYVEGPDHALIELLHASPADQIRQLFRTFSARPNTTRNTSARSVEGGAANRGFTATSQSDQAHR